MIFSAQRFVEDYFEQRAYSDTDQYAVRIANQFARYRSTQSFEAFLARLRHIRTIFYKQNQQANREVLLPQLIARLDGRFRSAAGRVEAVEYFPAPVVTAERRRLLKLRRRSIRRMLESFRHTTQARGIDTFWSSRKALKLRDRPEKIAQGMLSQFISGVLSEAPGQLFRELYSGVGFVDLVVMFSAVPHLIELKVQKGQFRGASQLENYMSNERRREGWLVIFDARPESKKVPIPETIEKPSGTINVIVVDINPVPPSRLED